MYGYEGSSRRALPRRPHRRRGGHRALGRVGGQPGRQLLRPYLIGRESRLPMLWLFLAIVGGLQTFGLQGLVIGPAALALFIACWRIYQQQRGHRTDAPAPPA